MFELKKQPLNDSHETRAMCVKFINTIPWRTWQATFNDLRLKLYEDLAPVAPSAAIVLPETLSPLVGVSHDVQV